MLFGLALLFQLVALPTNPVVNLSPGLVSTTNSDGSITVSPNIVVAPGTATSTNGNTITVFSLDVRAVQGSCITFTPEPSTDSNPQSLTVIAVDPSCLAQTPTPTQPISIQTQPNNCLLSSVGNGVVTLSIDWTCAGKLLGSITVTTPTQPPSPPTQPVTGSATITVTAPIPLFAPAIISWDASKTSSKSVNIVMLYSTNEPVIVLSDQTSKGAFNYGGVWYSGATWELEDSVTGIVLAQVTTK